MKNWKIGSRLSTGFALVLTLAIVMSAIGLWRLNVVADATAHMAGVPLSKERMISDWYRYVYSAVRRTTAIVKSTDPSLGQFFAAETTTSTQASADLQKQIEPLITGEKEKALWQDIMAQRKVYLSTRDAATKAKAEDNIEEATRLLEQGFIPAADKYMNLIQQLVTMQREAINEHAADIQATYTASQTLIITLCLFVLAIGAVLSYWLTRGITRPLARAMEVAQTVASGNLTSHIAVTSKDETGQLLQALKDMNAELVTMISEVRSGIETIATASTEIASGNQDLSARTEQQAGSLEETASSMEELTSTVRQNSDNARQANVLAESASAVAGKGGAVIAQVVTTMGDINDSAKRIVDIISVIDGIAFQTNILALNAAVEAARAGEQGRGFAVVASEVRSLAQRSASAAKEIKALIDTSVAKVENGSMLVNEAGATMNEIVDSVKRVTDIMAEITAAGQEQTSGIEQVNQAIGQMDQVTQQNAALVEEAAAAAQQLQDQAATLAQVVSVFKVDARNASQPFAAAATAVSAAVPAIKPRAALMNHAKSRSAQEEWEEF
jgi:methyl-accepting chemotaxis protein